MINDLCFVDYKIALIVTFRYKFFLELSDFIIIQERNLNSE
jgi:hypothetical protein